MSPEPVDYARPRRSVHDVPALRVRDLRPLLEHPERGAATVTWFSGETVRVNLRHVLDGDELLLLDHVHQGEPRSTSVAISRTPMHFGGARPSFSCATCTRSCMALYLLNGSFACRRCHDLVYPSQLSRAHQLRHTRRRLDQLQRELLRPRRRQHTRRRLARKLARARERVVELETAIARSSDVDRNVMNGVNAAGA